MKSKKLNYLLLIALLIVTIIGTGFIGSNISIAAGGSTSGSATFSNFWTKTSFDGRNEYVFCVEEATVSGTTYNWTRTDINSSNVKSISDEKLFQAAICNEADANFGEIINTYVTEYYVGDLISDSNFLNRYKMCLFKIFSVRQLAFWKYENDSSETWKTCSCSCPNCGCKTSYGSERQYCNDSNACCNTCLEHSIFGGWKTSSASSIFDLSTVGAWRCIKVDGKKHLVYESSNDGSGHACLVDFYYDDNPEYNSYVYDIWYSKDWKTNWEYATGIVASVFDEVNQVLYNAEMLVNKAKNVSGESAEAPTINFIETSTKIVEANDKIYVGPFEIQYDNLTTTSCNVSEGVSLAIMNGSSYTTLSSVPANGQQFYLEMTKEKYQELKDETCTVDFKVGYSYNTSASSVSGVHYNFSSSGKQNLIYGNLDVEDGSEEKNDEFSKKITIPNTYEPTTKDITVIKKWNDDLDTAGKRPDSIQVTLSGNNGYTKTITLSGSGDEWSYTFKDLDTKTGSGADIIYSVSEPSVPEGYESSVNGFTITNTYNPYEVDLEEINGIRIKIKKVMKDTNSPIEGIGFKLYYSFTDESVDNVVNNIINFAKKIINGTTSGFMDAIEKILVNIIQSSEMTGSDSSFETYGGLFDGVKDWWNEVKDSVENTIESIKQKVHDNISNLYNDHFADFKNKVTNLINGSTNKITELVENLYSGLTKKLVDGEVFTDENGECVLELTKEDIQEIVGTYSSIFEGLDGILGITTSIPGEVAGVDGNAVNNISGAFLQTMFKQFNPLNDFTLMIEESSPNGYLPVDNNGDGTIDDNDKNIYISGLTYKEKSEKETDAEGNETTITTWELTENSSGYYVEAIEDSEGEVTGYEIRSDGEENVKIENQSAIKKLTIEKLDSISGAKLSNAVFDIQLDNVAGIGKLNGNPTGATNSLTGVKTKDGKIVLEDIQLSNPSQPVTVTLTETSAPIGYKRVDKVVAKLVLDTNTYEYKVQKVSGNEAEFKESDTIVENKNEITLKIKDIPIMNLGGIVWEDTQTGHKVIKGTDGLLNNGEKGMAGVEVKLYDASGTQITKDVYGRDLIVKTAGTTDEQGNTISSPVSSVTYDLYNGNSDTIDLQQGQYIFPNIEAGTDYYVVFTYDGINYKTVDEITYDDGKNYIPVYNSSNLYEYTTRKETKVKEDEIDRKNFNEKFQTISDSSTGDSTSESYATAQNLGKNLTYVPTGDVSSGGIASSKLITKDSNANVLDNYKMSAKSIKTYLELLSDSKSTWDDNGKIKRENYALDINCGLTYRFFDLAIGMDVESAKLTINGKETTYDYNQILDGALSDIELDTLLDDNISREKADAENKKYNLYLYESDYRYRISDYGNDYSSILEYRNAINKTDFDDVNAYYQGKFATDKEEILKEQLRVFVTYKVIIKNQSTVENAKVNELAYYYDRHYKLVSAKDSAGNDITFVDDPSLPQIDRKTSARVSNFGQELDSANNYRQELVFTFELKRTDGAGNESEDGYLVTSGKEISFPGGFTYYGDAVNVVEILSYTTGTEGLVDNDSCPGNYTKFGHEDDTDTAQGLKIELKEETRTISGTVFYDENKDGKNDENIPVDDVTVQLIELKEIEGKTYEYIWQETTSGPIRAYRNLVFSAEQVKKIQLMDENQDGRIDYKECNAITSFVLGIFDRKEFPLLDKYLTYWEESGKDLNNMDREKFAEDEQYKVFWEALEEFETYDDWRKEYYEDEYLLADAYLTKIYDIIENGYLDLIDRTVVEDLAKNPTDASDIGISIKDGKYEFVDFIPGNYIIRFIYGDGTVYDITDNIEKYNGQDYKSTKDIYYNQEWYNKQIEAYETFGGAPGKASVARDNEARRLEVMSYSTTIDADLGATLESLNKEFSELTATETAKLQSYYTNTFLGDTTYRDWVQLKYNEYKEPDITDLATATPEQQYELLKYYVSQKTWMAAETSKINVPVDAESEKLDNPGKVSEGIEEKTSKDKTLVSFDYIVDRIEFNNVNFGLSLRPETKLELEKHITGIKITPNGTGVQSIVEAQADNIADIVNNTDPNGASIDTKGLKNGVTAMSSTRDSRGFWKVETDVEELAQGAILEIEYTYVIKNVSTEDDYLSSYLISAYESYYNGVKLDPTYNTYEQLLQGKGVEIKTVTKGKTHSYGTYLGQYYYTGTPGGSDALVSSRAETLEEALNEKLGKQGNVGNYFNIKQDASGQNISEIKTYIDDVGGFEQKEVNTIIESNAPSRFLTRNLGGSFTLDIDADWNKTARVTTVLSSITNGEIGGDYASYIAEITKYSSASGRRNMEAEPDNLEYVNSKDTEVTMNSIKYKDITGIVKETSLANPDVPADATILREANEIDEFWGETIIISKPTGEDKITGIQIAIIVTASVAILGVGIVLIKKFILKK